MLKKLSPLVVLAVAWLVRSAGPVQAEPYGGFPGASPTYTLTPTAIRDPANPPVPTSREVSLRPIAVQTTQSGFGAPCCPPTSQPTIGYAPASSATPVSSAPRAAYYPVAASQPVPTNYYVGRGVIGQPKVYVQGQPVRNVLRFLTP